VARGVRGCRRGDARGRGGGALRSRRVDALARGRERGTATSTMTTQSESCQEDFEWRPEPDVCDPGYGRQRLA
jgi:hypothetical protein